MEEISPVRSRSSHLSAIIGILVIAVLGAGGYYAWVYFGATPEGPKEMPIETPQAPQSVQYASSTLKFSLSYPPAFAVDEAYAYTRVSPTKPISGVKFVVPASFTQGTNLASDSGLSVETLPRAKLCTGDIYLKANVKSENITEGAITFSVATSSETTDGEMFEEAVFAVQGSSPCIAVRYFLHSTTLSSTTPAYDRTALLGAFDGILRSLSVQ